MALPRDYALGCSLSRSLEVVGERWTLLVIRDAFYGVRRFTDFVAHLTVPRAVLADRLALLVAHDVLERVPGAGGREEYQLTAKGRELWPVVCALMAWGDEHYAPDGPRRLFCHLPCGAVLDLGGTCPTCGGLPGADELEVRPGPGLAPPTEGDDAVTAALHGPHRLLQPLRAA